MIYEYTPLPPGRYVRLLELHPGVFNEPLRGSLHVVDLDTKPVYCAASYEWGSFAATKEIHLGGHILPLRANLHAFLLRLRRRSAQPLLWIDAISINQEANAERGHQVRLMRDIYSSAAEVLVWLGSGLRLARMAMAMLRDLLRGTGTAESLLQPQGLQCLETLFGLRYWTRLWIVQEVVLATKATLFYDQLSLKWSCFEKLLRVLKGTKEPSIPPCASSAATQATGAPVHLPSRKAQAQPTAGGAFLVSIYRPKRQSEAGAFEIDYTKDIYDLFGEVIAFCAVPALDLPRFAYLLQRSLGIRRGADYTNVLMTQKYLLEQHSVLKKMWFRRRYGRDLWISDGDSPHFLPCEGLRLGRIIQAHIRDPTSVLSNMENGFFKHRDGSPILASEFSTRDVLEMCINSAYHASPADIPRFKMLELACRALRERRNVWRRRTNTRASTGRAQLESLPLESVGMKFVLVEWDTLATTKLTLALAPPDAADGDAVFNFRGHPILFLTTESRHPPLLRPIYVSRRCGINWGKLESVYQLLSQWRVANSNGIVASPVVPDKLENSNNRTREFLMSFSELRKTF